MRQMANVTNRDLVLYALFISGGAEKPIHTEDVAAQVFRFDLGRQRYRWQKYAQFPDKERILRELRRLKVSKGGPLIRGHANIGAKRDRVDGWSLTSLGVDRVKAIEETLKKALGGSGSHHRYSEETLRQRISKASCYRAYLRGPRMAELKDHEFTDMLRCLPDAPNDKIRSTYDNLMARAKAVGAEDLQQFLRAARKRFSKFFEG